MGSIMTTMIRETLVQAISDYGIRPLSRDAKIDLRLLWEFVHGYRNPGLDKIEQLAEFFEIEFFPVEEEGGDE